MTRFKLGWAAAGLLIVMRLALLAISVPPHASLTGDEPIYDHLAHSLNSGAGYSYHHEPWVWKPPGWPIVLAGLYRTLGEDRRALIVVQGVFDALTALLLGWTATRTFGSPRAGALTFLMILLWPPFFRESRFLQTEPLFTACLALTTASFALLVRSRRPAVGFLVGLAGGLASLARPTGLVPLAGLILGWWLTQPREWKRMLVPVALIALGVVVVLAPWTLRNARVFGAFIPISTGGGELFYMGTTPETDGRWDNRQWGGLSDKVLNTEVQRLGHRLNPLERDRAFLNAGLENWRRDPVLSAKIALKRAWRLWFLPLGSGDRPALRVMFLLVLLGLYALAVPEGIANLRAGGTPRVFAGIAFIAVLIFGLASSTFYTNSRYIEPIRPLLLLLAAGALARRTETRSPAT